LLRSGWFCRGAAALAAAALGILQAVAFAAGFQDVAAVVQVHLIRLAGSESAEHIGKHRLNQWTVNRID
jgi:hypothetical protein